MALTVSAGEQKEFEVVPEGNYVARCFKIIDLGTQDTEWQGEKKLQRKVLFGWELLDDEVHMADGRPFSVSKRYTLSLHEKAQLRKDLQSWRGKRFTDDELKGFDLTKVLGSYCQLQVVHVESNGNTYANIDAIMSTREKPVGVNPLIKFDINEPDMEVFESLSDRLKEQIQSTPEWNKKPGNTQLDQVAEVIEGEPINLDDIPF